MDLNLGYRQTEVGVMPIDWEVKPLSSISCKVTDGDHLTPKRARSGYYLLSARNVRNGRVDLGDVDYVGVDEYRRMKQRCNPEPGDILISCSGNGYGRVAIVPEGLECVLVRSAALVKIDQSQVDSRFIQYWLQATHAQAQIENSVSRAAQPNLFINSIERLKCPIAPTISEQRAIAAALSDVDALLAGLDRLLAKKRDVKQAAMQQLLTGSTLLPGFAGEWEVQRLGSIGTFVKGSGIRKDEAASGDIPCVRYGELYTRHHDVVRQFTSRISRSVAAQATRLKRGDILFAGSGETKEEIGKAVAFVDDCEAYAGGDIVILRPHSSDSTFLGYYLNTPPIQVQKASRGQGDAVVHIGAAALAAIEITMPVDTAEQSAIATVLSDMDAELAALEQRRDKTLALKQGMMQELLTGRTRLV